jgi:ribosomal-protein-alanine N-acetyltransferase
MIKTERLTIRRVKEEDFEGFLEVQTDQESRKYLGGVVEQDKVSQKFSKMITDQESLYFTVLRNEEFTGLITIGYHTDEKAHELSYQFLPRFWNKGYAIESIEAVLKLVKEKRNMIRLIAETQSANTRSIKLLEKIGMTFDKELIRFSEKQSIYRLDD